MLRTSLYAPFSQEAYAMIMYRVSAMAARADFFHLAILMGSCKYPVLGQAVVSLMSGCNADLFSVGSS